jgi:ribonuclease PH
MVAYPLAMANPNRPNIISLIQNRSENRADGQLRTFHITPGVAPHAHGSVLVATGNTQVICSAIIEEGVPKWMKEQGISGGWITAEYSMLPYSTLIRRPRDISNGRLDGRGVEIQRLIGRSLRAAVDLEALGLRTLWIDCDVLQADGGTRTASINGASIAVGLAAAKLLERGVIQRWPMRCLVGAVSVGIVAGRPLVDLDYEEDKNAVVDMNLVMTGAGEFIEIQGAGEEATFSASELEQMLVLGKTGIAQLIHHQHQALLAANVNHW